MRDSAKDLGLNGTPCVQWVQTAGREFEKWETSAYRITLVDRQNKLHSVIAYSIHTITIEDAAVKVDGLIHCFKKLGIQSQSVERPSGSVDLLVGLQYAALHPRCIAVSGQLRLLTNMFGTVYLLDGCHKSQVIYSFSCVC